MFQSVLLDNLTIKVLLKRLFKKNQNTIPYSSQMRKNTLIKNVGSCAKKKLLKDCTEELALAAAETTDAGGLSVPDTVAVMFFLYWHLLKIRKGQFGTCISSNRQCLF